MLKSALSKPTRLFSTLSAHSTRVRIARTPVPMTEESPMIFAPPTYQYEKGHLNEADVDSNPLSQFNKWFHEAQQALPEGSTTIPESVVFSTARLPEGRVSSRVVLLKELDSHGFIIYSNWATSKKAKDYESNKFASLTFFWSHIQRQVRVEGVMEKVTRETSQRYFKTRPRGSKIGAWASPQSEQIHSRDDLDRLYKEYDAKFADLPDDEIPCPDFWGGVRIVPLEIEFWQGGVSRLHDRLTFTRPGVDDAWDVKRISP
ncbi:hypothetical protein JCM33374_g6117 [Metschnikowia sp. JCM 33374]|nr:hypothetical protein JCM33374_g6117 [Metschnikowia sp. JCM 33374]